MPQNDDIAYNYVTCATLSTGAYVTFHYGWCHLFIYYIHCSMHHSIVQV